MTKTQVLYPPEVREKSIAMVFDTRDPDESLKAACGRGSAREREVRDFV